MPATTSKGLPYPLGTDRLMDGDDQIRKLAQAVENYVQSGTVTLQTTALNTNADATVIFPVAYSAPPAVVLTMLTGFPQSFVVSITGGSITAAQFVARGRNIAGTPGAIQATWVAAGPIAPVA